MLGWCWDNCPCCSPQPQLSLLAQASFPRRDAFARHQWQWEQGLPQVVGARDGGCSCRSVGFLGLLCLTGQVKCVPAFCLPWGFAVELQ